MSDAPRPNRWQVLWNRAAHTPLRELLGATPEPQFSVPDSVNQSGLPAEVIREILQVSHDRSLPRREPVWPWWLLTALSLCFGPVVLIVGPWCWWRWHRAERRAWAKELTDVSQALVSPGMAPAQNAEEVRHYCEQAVAAGRLRAAIGRRGWRPSWSWLAGVKRESLPQPALFACSTGAITWPRAPAGLAAPAVEVPVSTVLPTAALDRVSGVLRRSRLWPSEKALVAQELLAHIEDGLAAHRPLDELLGEFGDERQVATLIRRSRIRLRPLAWHVWRRSLQASMAAVALFVLYCGGLWLQFRLARTPPPYDMYAELDEVGKRHRAEGAAWPYYRRVLEVIRDPELDRTHPNWREAALTGPSHPDWEAAQGWLERNRNHLDLVTRGAAQPQLGFVYRDPENAAWLKVTAGPHASIEKSFATPSSPIGTLLPHIQDLRQIHYLLLMACRDAIERNDFDAALDWLESQSALERQLASENAFVVTQLVALAWSRGRQALAGTLLARATGKLNDTQLNRWERMLPAPADLDDTIDRRACRLTLESLYASDDADCRLLLPRGLEILHTPYFSSPQFVDRQQPGSTSGPLGRVANELQQAWIAGSFASLGESLQTFENLRDALDKARSGNEADVARYRQLHDEITSDPVQKWRLIPVLALMQPPEPLEGQPVARPLRERLESQALKLALQAERTFVETGHYPHSLSEVGDPASVSDFQDPFAPARPLDWKVTQHGPVIYSIGPDGIDDGGIAGPDGGRMGIPERGDWVLYPPQGAFPPEPASALAPQN